MFSDTKITEKKGLKELSFDNFPYLTVTKLH